MFTQEDILRHIREHQQRNSGGGSGGSGTEVQISVEKLDEFIDTAMKRDTLTLEGLMFELRYLLQPPEGHTTMLSFPEVDVYPIVLQRIQNRMGEREN